MVPSFPGLGFSDAFSATSGTDRGDSELKDTAELFNILMRRLGYEFYVASATGCGLNSPANIDYHLARLIGELFPQTCLGIHLIAPPILRPRPRREIWLWLKFGLARFFHANIWGYEAEYWKALRDLDELENPSVNQQRGIEKRS